jgi:hypothetical protein
MHKPYEWHYMQSKVFVGSKFWVFGNLLLHWFEIGDVTLYQKRRIQKQRPDALMQLLVPTCNSIFPHFLSPIFPTWGGPFIKMHASGRYLRDTVRKSLFFVQNFSFFVQRWLQTCPNYWCSKLPGVEFWLPGLDWHVSWTTNRCAKIANSVKNESFCTRGYSSPVTYDLMQVPPQKGNFDKNNPTTKQIHKLNSQRNNFTKLTSFCHACLQGGTHHRATP